MTKEEALKQLLQGKRVKHIPTFPNDSIRLSNGRYYWEDGNSLSVEAFWHYRTEHNYNDNWEEVENTGFIYFSSLPAINVKKLVKEIIHSQV